MWERIKNILEKEGGKCIVIEQGKPSYLVMRLEDYETDKVNQDINQWKAEEESSQEPEANQSSQEVRVEDLPF